MAVSGSYDKTTTAYTIIKNAVSEINAYDDDEPLPAEMYVYCLDRLNKVMSFFSVHKGLWLIEDITVTLVPGTPSYSIGDGETIDNPKPMRVPHARRVTGTTEITIDVDSRQNYMSIPNKTLQAPCNMVYYHPGRTTGTVYVWPTGTATDKTIIIETQRPVQDFDAQGNNPDLPKEWFLLVELMLATFIAPKYLGGVVPPGTKDNLKSLLSTLGVFDEEETTINFQP
jgi:hypothetical protein